MQTYKMTLFNAHIEPFYNVESPKMHKHVTSESWETEDDVDAEILCGEGS